MCTKVTVTSFSSWFPHVRHRLAFQDQLSLLGWGEEISDLISIHLVNQYKQTSSQDILQSCSTVLHLDVILFTIKDLVDTFGWGNLSQVLVWWFKTKDTYLEHCFYQISHKGRGESVQPNWELGTSELLAYPSKMSEGGRNQIGSFSAHTAPSQETTYIVGVILPPEPQ